MQDLTSYSTFPTNTKEEELRATLEQLKIQYENEERKVRELNEEIEKSFDIMRDENKKYESMHEELLEDIYYLEKETQVIEEVEEEEIPTVKPEELKDAKKLYHRISGICHPDKTSNEKLHEVFLEAKKAYDNNDIDHLNYLYSIIVTDQEIDLSTLKNIDNAYNALEKAIQSLRKKIKEEKEEYKRVLVSMGYAIHKRLNSPLIRKQMRARHEYSELLFRKIEKAAVEKEKLLQLKEEKKNGV